MEKVTSANNPATVAAQSTTANIEKKGNAPQSAAQSQLVETAAESDISMASVVARAEEGKLKSLSTLQSVSESIDDAIQVLNQALSLKSTAAVIRRDSELNRYLVTITDKDSGEIVREIPDEALLKFARNLQELRGILFDETT